MTNNEQFIDRFYKFSGRSSRSMYWTTMIITYVVCGTVLGIAVMVGKNAPGDFGGVLAGIGGLVFCYVILCNNIRRVHDLGYSGWVWAAAIVVASVFVGVTAGTELGLVLKIVFHAANFIIMGCLPGNEYRNQYGDPVVGPNAPGMHPTLSSGSVARA